MKISTLRKSPSGELGVKDKNMTFRGRLKIKYFSMTETVIIPISVLIVLLAVILFTFNRKQNSNVLFISLFLVIFAIQMATTGIGNFDGPVWLYAVLLVNFSPFYYLIPVLLYFFVRGTFSGIPLRKKDMLHLIPFLIAFVSIIPYMLTSNAYKLAAAEKVLGDYHAYADFDFGFLYPPYYNQLVRPVILLLYLRASLVIVRKYRIQHKSDSDAFSARNRYFLRPVFTIITLFAVYAIFSLFLYNQYFFNVDLSIIRLEAKILFYYSLAVYLSIPVYLMFNPEILYARESVQMTDEVPITVRKPACKPEKPCQDASIQPASHEDNYIQLTERILEYLTNEKPYLNDKFSVHDICINMNVPRHHVQYCFNVILGKSFTELKNEMRIAYAMELIINNKSNNLTLEGIGKQAGFASNSNFYGSFRDVNGMTPKKWMEQGKASQPPEKCGANR
jgi:AraC-like DNA-binding protein